MKSGSVVMSVPEAAQRLGISPHTLRSWLRQGRLAYHRVGRRIVLDLADLVEFMRQHRVEALKPR